MSSHLTADEAARLANRTLDQVRHILRRGLVPDAVRIGRTWAIPQSAVESIKTLTKAQG